MKLNKKNQGKNELRNGVYFTISCESVYNLTKQSLKDTPVIRKKYQWLYVSNNGEKYSKGLKMYLTVEQISHTYCALLLGCLDLR